MKDFEKLYLTNEYVLQNPSLHVEDSHWKVTKIRQLLDGFLNDYKENFELQKLSILDAGGGAGLILKKIAGEIEKNYGIEVKKYALDASPHALEIQKETNPDLKKALNESICKTSIKTNEIDLALFIDVLEHLPDPISALNELKRVSKFVIMKVPLEDNLYCNTMNAITKGKFRENLIETCGHINVYDFKTLKHQIEENLGKIVNYYYTNVFQYLLSKSSNLRSKVINKFAAQLYRISPTLCSIIFYDFVILLIKC